MAELEIKRRVQIAGGPKDEMPQLLPRELWAATCNDQCLYMGNNEGKSVKMANYNYVENIENNTVKIQNSDNGFAGGKSATSTNGGAVGNGAKTTNGGAVGSAAQAYGGGGAIGNDAQSYYGGGTIGSNTYTEYGGSIGSGARSKKGFAGGQEAIASGDNNIQLGKGTNTEDKTLKVYDYKLMNADGTIPTERLQNASAIGAAKLTFTATASFKVTAKTYFQVQDGTILKSYISNGVAINVSTTSNDVFIIGDLIILDLNYTPITLFNVAGLTNLQTLYINGAQMTSFDGTGLTNLQNLQLNVSKITTFNGTGLTNLQTLQINAGDLTTFNGTGLTNLKTLQLISCSKLTSFDGTGLTNLQTLDLNGSGILATVLIPKYSNVTSGTNGFTTLKLHSTPLTTGTTITPALQSILDNLPTRHSGSKGNISITNSTLRTTVATALAGKYWDVTAS